MMAGELRVVAVEAKDERTKRSLTPTANYDRAADSWSTIEKFSAAT